MSSCKFFPMISRLVLCLIIYIYYIDIGICLLELKAGMSRSIPLELSFCCYLNVSLNAMTCVCLYIFTSTEVKVTSSNGV